MFDMCRGKYLRTAAAHMARPNLFEILHDRLGGKPMRDVSREKLQPLVKKRVARDKKVAQEGGEEEGRRGEG